MNYTGYVYIWYDTKAKFFYIGGHYGRVEDRYVCSNRPMLRAYNLRPNTFRIKILEYINGTTTDLRVAEQRWLNMISDHELMNTINVQTGTCRYYNVKKNSTGGNGKGTNKGKSHPSWNKGMTKGDMLSYKKKSNIPKKLIELSKTSFKPPRKILPILHKTCPTCTQTFNTKRESQKYCCRKCGLSKLGETRKTLGLGKKSAQYLKPKMGNLNPMRNPQILKIYKDQITGRKRKYREDGTWHWEHKNKEG